MIYLLAFLGGMILNLMPCVLPVLFLKAMSLQRRSWAYVSGVMSVFLVLGFAAASGGYMWGGQFDHWWFTWGTAAICFALGLTYLDVWSLPNFGCREAESDFHKGVLTTVLSSACSGPFLGAVFAASLTQPAWKIITLFLTIGAGLVTPYLLFPRSWIPRPGAWMDTLKKLAGISMIATSAWLVVGSTSACIIVGVLLAIVSPVHGRRRLALAGVYILFTISLTLFTLCNERYPVEKFNEARLVTLRANDRVVLVEYTSRFCSTCQLNAMTIQSWAVRNVMSKHDVVLMQAMVPENADSLKSMGFTSVPLLVVYAGPNVRMTFPDVVSKSQVTDAIEQSHELLKAYRGRGQNHTKFEGYQIGR